MNQTTTSGGAIHIPPFVNHAMDFILHSPVHGVISKTIMDITFTGRKSGKQFTTPVSYSQQRGQVYVFTHATWWKNLRGGAPVTMCIRGQEFRGVAEPVAEDKQAVAAGLMGHLRKVRSDARFYGVTFDDQGNPRAEQVAQAARNVVMIRIRLT